MSINFDVVSTSNNRHIFIENLVFIILNIVVMDIICHYSYRIFIDEHVQAFCRIKYVQYCLSVCSSVETTRAKLVKRILMKLYGPLSLLFKNRHAESNSLVVLLLGFLETEEMFIEKCDKTNIRKNFYSKCFENYEKIFQFLFWKIKTKYINFKCSLQQML